MTEFYLRLAVYLLSFVLSFYCLSALDFNRFLKKGKTVQAQILYFVIACCVAYLFGNFLMAVIYRFNR